MASGSWMPPLPRDPIAAALEGIASGPRPAWRADYRIDETIYSDLEKSKSFQTMEGLDQSLLDTIFSESKAETSIHAMPPENPHVERKIRALVRDWAVYARKAYPLKPLEDLWKSDFIIAFAVLFLTLRVRVHLARADSLKAVTLFNWATIMNKCIIRYSRGPDGRPDGDYVLLNQNLHTAIQVAVKSLIKMYKLDRYQGNKLYYGRWEVLLILAWLLKSSQHTARNERFVKMQTACLVIICFYIVARPGSLAPSCDEFLERKLLLLLGDVKIYLLNGIWECRVAITIRSWKGQSERTTATARVYHLDSVTKAHNVILDPAVWIVTYMLYRGAFGPNYKTLKDLESAKQAVLEVIPEKCNEPFFLACTEGGHDLVPGKAATVNNISHNFRHACIAAGLPGGSIYALRRDGGNDFSLKAGSVIASLSLGHNNAGSDNSAGTRTTTFHQHYSRITADLPYTSLRLGETQEKTDEFTMRRVHMLDFMRKSIDAWINMNTTSLAPSHLDVDPAIDMNEVNKSFLANSGLTDHSKVLIWKDTKVSKSRQQVMNHWKAYLTCFPAEATTYHHDSTHATPTISLLLKDFPRRFASPKETREREEALRAVIASDAKVRRTVTNTVRQAQKNGISLRAFDTNRAENTFDNRNDGMTGLANESTRMLTEAVARQIQPPASVDSRGLHPSECLAAASRQSAVGPGNAGRATSAVSQSPIAGSSNAANVPPGNSLPSHQFDDPYRHMEALSDDPEPPCAPWDRPTDTNAWDVWRSGIETVRARMTERAGTLEEEYELAKDTTLASEMLDAEKGVREKKHEKMPNGNKNAHLLFLQSEVGVPPRPPGTATEGDAASESNEADVDYDAAGTMSLVSTEVTPPTAKTAAVITETYRVADDQQEPNVLGVPCPELCALLAADIVGPLERNRVIAEYFEQNGNRWKCPLCREFTHNGDADRVWGDRGKLEYHMRIHTPWHALQLQMVSQNGQTWTCPSCSVTKSSLQAIQHHCVNKCPQKTVYLAMQAAHVAVTNHHGTERRREEKLRKLDIVDEPRFEPDTADPRVAQALREVILDIRHWNIDQKVNEGIQAGKITEADRASKTKAFKVMQEFSQRAWESSQFYSVPVRKAC